MIKELFQLIKMIFQPIPQGETVGTIIMKHFPFPGFSAMMWCGHIIVREEYKESITGTTLNHENIHLCQAKLHGSWWKYYLSYLWNWAKHNPFSKSAYFLNKYEGEAFANQSNIGYIRNYTGKNLYKYDLGHKVLKACGSIQRYLNFIETL